MPIDLVHPLPVGNALRLILSPPAGALFWRVLRRTDDTFSGAADTGAVRVLDDDRDNSVLDRAGLVNGTPYFYAMFAWDGAAWSQVGDVVSATPQATYADGGPDVQAIVRERLELGLAIEVARGALQPASGKIPVTTAPFAHQSGITFPTVSVHHDSSVAADRSIGELMLPDHLQPDGALVTGGEGWMARVTLNIYAVSLNPDERAALREAIRRVIQANLGVFAAEGIILPNLSQRDEEQFVENNAPLYATVGIFDCEAPAFVTDSGEPIETVTVMAEALNV